MNLTPKQIAVLTGMGRNDGMASNTGAGRRLRTLRLTDSGDEVFNLKYEGGVVLLELEECNLVRRTGNRSWELTEEGERVLSGLEKASQ